MKLIDCYTELLAYMAYLTGDPSAAAVSYEDASKKFDELCGRAETIRTQAKIGDNDWREGLFAVAALPLLVGAVGLSLPRIGVVA